MAWFYDMLAAQGLPALLAAAGQTVTYKYADGSSAVITAVVGPESKSDAESESGEDLTTARDVVIQASDVADPAVNDEIEIGGVTWAIDGVLERNDAGSKVRITLVEAVRKSRPGYRKGT